ncbi:MAG: hypothetical protein WCC08_24650, partial [Terrimicrobiaceae bacterium]
TTKADAGTRKLSASPTGIAARPNWPARSPGTVGKSIRTRNVRADYFFGDRMRLRLDRLYAHRDNRR